MTTIKLLQGCSDAEKFKGLIRVAAPARVHGKQLNGQDGLLQCSSEDFVLALDALRVLSMADRSREDAAPRLSAYLLLDAALGTQI